MKNDFENFREAVEDFKGEVANIFHRMFESWWFIWFLGILISLAVLFLLNDL